MTLTTETIAERVARYLDLVNHLLATRAINQDTHDKCVAEINERAEMQYRALARCK